MWFTTEQGLDGPVYGAADQWNGVGVFFDSFDNDGKVSVYLIGLGITRYLAIRYYHNILPMITILSQYSDSAIIDIYCKKFPQFKYY